MVLSQPSLGTMNFDFQYLPFVRAPYTRDVMTLKRMEMKMEKPSICYEEGLDEAFLVGTKEELLNFA